MSRAWERAHEEHDAACRRLIAQVSDWAEAHPECSVRLCETMKGLRAAIIGLDVEPASDEAQQMMRELNADRLCSTLCRRHNTTRARHTAKPWRVNAGDLRVHAHWPGLDDAERAAYRDWVAEYEHASAGTATARLIGGWGPGEAESYSTDHAGTHAPGHAPVPVENASGEGVPGTSRADDWAVLAYHEELAGARSGFPLA